MLGYVGLSWAILGYLGLCWAMLGYVGLSWAWKVGKLGKCMLEAASVREAVYENMLHELKNLWHQKLEADKAVEQPSRGNDAAALDAKMNMTRGNYLGGGLNHFVIALLWLIQF